MNNISKEINEEQNKIINANENIVIVSACPGSGKTYIISKKAEKLILENKGIIVCSFTNESSNELKKRILKNKYYKNCIICTLDSLVKNIILDFLNRFLIINNFETINKSNLSIKIKNDRNLFCKLNETDFKNYLNKWFESLILHKEYIVSPLAFSFCIKMIEELSILKDYICLNYKYIIIDEAQDLNKYQMSFIKCLRNICKLKIMLVGDENQSIFGFNGSDHNLFLNSFSNRNDIIKLTMNTSYRCDSDILSFANYIKNENNNLKLEKNNISIIEDILDINDLLKNNNTMILCRTKQECKKYFDSLKEHNKIIYKQKIEIDIFKDYQKEFGDACEFYFNWNNEEKNFITPINEFLDLYNLKNTEKKKFISSLDKNLKEFIIVFF